jgi:hypothetical protein
VLWFSGDVISQKADGRAWSDLDWRRTARITAYGLCVAGASRPFCHLGHSSELCAHRDRSWPPSGPVYCWWYSFLERKTAHLAQRSVWKYIAAKVYYALAIVSSSLPSLFLPPRALVGGR